MQTSKTEQREVTLEIDGMGCGGCVSRVSKLLESIDGIHVHLVELGKAVVHAPEGIVEAAPFLSVLRDAGYRAAVTSPGVDR